jgi:hypothetical protein
MNQRVGVSSTLRNTLDVNFSERNLKEKTNRGRIKDAEVSIGFVQASIEVSIWGVYEEYIA